MAEQKSSEKIDQKISNEKLAHEISLSNHLTSDRTNDINSMNNKQASERLETDESYTSLNTSLKQNLHNSHMILLNSNNSNEVENLKKINNNIYIGKKKQNVLLKSIECILHQILLESILLIISSIILKFLADKKDNFPLACIIISISSFLLNVFLVVAVKFAFTNNPNEMKLFRISIITAFLLLFVNFVFQICGSVTDYLIYGKFSAFRIFSYSFLGFSSLLIIPTFIKGLKLCKESFLILINCKKEYKDLFVDEKEKYFIYDKFCRENCDFRGKASVFDNVRNYIHEKEIMERINPIYNKFHNSLRKNRNDDEFYRKLK